MRKGACAIVFAVLGLVSAPLWPLTFDLPSSGTPGVEYVQDGPKQVTFRINWYLLEEAKFPSPKRAITIPADSSVSLHVTNFNFMHFSLRYTVEEEVIESYQALEKLWSQIFRLQEISGGISGVQPSPDPFEQKVVEWRQKQEDAQQRVATYLEEYSTLVGLPDSAITRMKDVLLPAVTTDKQDLEALRYATRQLAATNSQFDTYVNVKRLHEDTLSILNSFIERGVLTVNGEIHPIGTKKSGTSVTLRIQPVQRDNDTMLASQPFSASYFVRSKYPVLFHVGYSYSTIDDVEFEKVRALNDQDLFAMVTNSSDTEEATTLLSYELLSWGENSRFGVLATLGTGLSEPGETLYVGSSFKIYDRAFISVGALSAEKAEAGDRVLEAVGTELETRELFESFSRRRKWEPFIAISFSVF